MRNRHLLDKQLTPEQAIKVFERRLEYLESQLKIARVIEGKTIWHADFECMAIDLAIEVLREKSGS